MKLAAALVALLSVPSASSLGRRQAVVVLRGGGKRKAPIPPAPVPQVTKGAIGKVIGWTVAETVLTYGILTWAAASQEPNLELAAAAVVVYLSATLADVLLAATATTLSTAARQTLVPTKVPDQRWYEALPKPRWTPPGWIFPIMWLLVCKPPQVLALGRLHSGELNAPARITFCLHLALGDAWNRVFFGENLVGLAAVVIYCFLAVLVASAALFAAIDPTTGALLLPTIAWVNVAAALNLRIYQLQKKKYAQR